MKILHITAQKPDSTGSGVYMSGLIQCLDKLGHKQAVITGIDIKDNKNSFKENIRHYPMIYNSGKLNFSVIGMSDNMPYESTKYKDLTPDMVKIIKEEFLNTLKRAVKEFKPEVIVCNHLYLITSFVREAIKDIKIIGICHGTCLRQLKNIDLEKDYIISNINNLDYILTLHENQRKDIIDMFNIKGDKVEVIGSGYDDKIFYNKNYTKGKTINITYAGKLCKSKGLKSLLQSLDKVKYSPKDIIINFAGSGSDKSDVNEIKYLAEKSKYKVEFHGRLNHDELSDLFNKSDIFILPSFYEGLPIVVLEALACGVKVIVSEIEGLKEFIGDEINSSGNISYLNLPPMKSAGVPFENKLFEFEDNMAKTLEKSIINIKNKSENKNISLKNKTWDGLAKKVEIILENIILKF